MKRFPVLGLFLLAFNLSLSGQSLIVKDGDTVAFMGDSITAQGAGGAGGYVRLVESGLKANGITITVIPAGISGEKSDQMLARLESSVLSKKPNVMTLSCGVNDVWHQEKGGGVQLEDYKKNIMAIVDGADKAGVKVVLLTATLIKEDLKSVSNEKAVAYNDFLREFAKERSLPLADLNADMRKEWEAILASGSKKQLTNDGVHMNYLGNLMMARGVLRGFGFNEEQMAKAETSWKTIPALVPVDFRSGLSLDEMAKVEEQATKAGKPTQAYIREVLDAALKKEVGN